MKCQKVVKFIPEYLEDAVASSISQEIEKHLENCDSCRKELHAYQKTIQLSSSLPVEYPSKEKWNNFVPELLSKIEDSSEKPILPFSWQFIWRHAWQFAGVVVSIAIIVAVVFNNSLFVVRQPQNEPKTVEEVISESFVSNISVEQIDKAIQSINYPVTSGRNMIMIYDEINKISVEESPPEATDIANAMAIEIDSSQLNYDSKLVEAIAYIEEYSMSKGE